LILVTARPLSSLKAAFPQLKLFDRVIAENGALLLHPKGQEKLLSVPPPESLVRALRDKDFSIIVGRVMVLAASEDARAIRTIIRTLNLKLQLIPHKESLLILPEGVDKSTGLRYALEELRILPQHVVGIGNADNDPVFLRTCGCAVAVANAIASVKKCAAIVTRGDHGSGVVEIINQILHDDLAEYDLPVVTDLS
jgi:hydroxymethylpyrimidine pyrophosphatase-like HAD family hydrolase